MPADPYTLGIGVEIDKGSTTLALDRFGDAVEKYVNSGRMGGAASIGELLSAGIDPNMLLKKYAFDSFDKLRLHLAAVTDDAKTAFSSIEGFVDFFRSGSDWTKPAEELESATQKMAATMGNGRVEAAGLRQDIYSLAETTGYSLEQTTELSRGLADTGQTLGSFSFQTQTALVTLSSQFGVSGEEASKMATSMGGLGGDINSLLGDATGFTKGFHLPGLFQELPGLVEGARHATLTFSSSVVGTGNDVVAATMNMGGAFAKAFGTTIAEGLGRAQEALTKVRGAAQQDADVFLGLGDQFSGLTMAIMQTGKGIHGAMDIVRGAGKGDLGALEELATIKDRMPEGVMKDRFMRQLQKELPEDMLALVTDVDKLHKVMADKKAAEDFKKSMAGKGVKSFNDLGKSVLDTTAGFRAMFNNSLELVQSVLMTSGVTDILRDTLESAKETFQGFAGQIRDFTNSEGFKEKVAEWKPVIVGTLKALLSVGTVISTVGGAAITLGGSIFGLTSGFTSAGKILSRFGSMVPGVGGALEGVGGIMGKVGGFFGKVFGKLGPIGMAIASFEGVKTAVMDMGAVLGNPNATGMEKFEALVRGSLKGIGKFFDTVLLGIPSKIANFFFPDLESNFDGGISDLFKTIKGYFSGPGLSNLLSTVGGWVNQLGDYMIENMPSFTAAAKSFGLALGGAIGGISKMLFDGVISAVKTSAELVTDLFMTNFNEIGSGIEDSSVAESVLGVLDTVGESLISFFKGTVNGVLGAFGTNIEQMSTRFQIVWEEISYLGVEAWKYLSNGYMTNFSDPLSLGLLDIGSDLEEFWVGVKFGGKMALEWLDSAATQMFSNLKIGALALAESIAGAFADMAKANIASFKSLIDILPDSTPGLASMKEGIEKAKSGIDSLTEGFSAATNQAIVEGKVAKTLSQGRMAVLEGEKAVALSAIDAQRTADQTAMAERAKLRETDSAQRKKDHEDKIGQLGAQLNAQEAAFNTEQELGMEATRFREGSRSQMEQALQTIGADAAKMGASDESTRAATSAMRDFMSEQVTTISDQVAKGAITAEDAAKRLQDAAAQGLKGAEDKLQKKKASDVADEAGGPGQTAHGLNKEAVAQMMANARQQMASDRKRAQAQRVDVNLKGDGELTRGLARNAAKSNLSTNGGS